MTGEPPQQPVETLPPAPERDPFWGYTDVLLFIGLALPSMFFGLLAVRGALRLFHVHLTVKAIADVPAQFLGYALLFGALMLIFRYQYDRPFWRSLAWTDSRLPFLSIVICGLATAFGLAVVGVWIGTPTTSNPMMEEMLQSRTSIVLIAIFGVTVGPLCEELIFRGFLQPLLVRSLGAAPGILAATAAFGLMHYPEYGNSWRHALLVSAAGGAFGWMRHATGSTKAAAIMHAAYNSLFFFGLFASRKEFPVSW